MGRAVCAYRKAAVNGFLGALGSFSFFSRLRLVPLPGFSAAASVLSLSAAEIAWAMPLAVEAASMVALAVAAISLPRLSFSRTPSSPAMTLLVCSR
jgi:hypothetical protein